MSLTSQEVICWLIVGGLVGHFVGRIVTRKKEGFGHWINLGVGLVGALIGGLIFELFKITFGDDITISLNNVLAAFAGALLFLIGVWIVRKFRGKSPNPAPKP